MLLLGVTVLVGNEVLNAFVPVNVLLPESETPPILSTYAFVVSCVDVVGVTVDVGNEVLNAFVPVNVLFDPKIDAPLTALST